MKKIILFTMILGAQANSVNIAPGLTLNSKGELCMYGVLQDRASLDVLLGVDSKCLTSDQLEKIKEVLMRRSGKDEAVVADVLARLSAETKSRDVQSSTAALGAEKEPVLGALQLLNTRVVALSTGEVVQPSVNPATGAATSSQSEVKTKQTGNNGSAPGAGQKTDTAAKPAVQVGQQPGTGAAVQPSVNPPLAASRERYRSESQVEGSSPQIKLENQKVVDMREAVEKEKNRMQRILTSKWLRLEEAVKRVQKAEDVLRGIDKATGLSEEDQATAVKEAWKEAIKVFFDMLSEDEEKKRLQLIAKEVFFRAIMLQENGIIGAATEEEESECLEERLSACEKRQELTKIIAGQSAGIVQRGKAALGNWFIAAWQLETVKADFKAEEEDQEILSLILEEALFRVKAESDCLTELQQLEEVGRREKEALVSRSVSQARFGAVSVVGSLNASPDARRPAEESRLEGLQKKQLECGQRVANAETILKAFGQRGGDSVDIWKMAIGNLIKMENVVVRRIIELTNSDASAAQDQQLLEAEKAVQQAMAAEQEARKDVAQGLTGDMNDLQGAITQTYELVQKTLAEQQKELSNVVGQAEDEHAVASKYKAVLSSADVFLELCTKAEQSMKDLLARLGMSMEDMAKTIQSVLDEWWLGVSKVRIAEAALGKETKKVEQGE